MLRESKRTSCEYIRLQDDVENISKKFQDKEKEPKFTAPCWVAFLNVLQQLSLAEKSYIEIGFLQNKHKSFLRKDVKQTSYLIKF